MALTETEIRDQWRAAVDILETGRNFVDATMANNGGKFDTLLAALEGEHTPELAEVLANHRAALSATLSPEQALSYLDPVIRDYATLIDTFGRGSENLSEIKTALYDYMHANSITVQSRQITYGTPSAGGSNNGNGTLTRLTVDENAYDLEAVTVETKDFKCTYDQNNGTNQYAEIFEVRGAPRSPDDVLRYAGGSGIPSGAPNGNTIRHRHAGAANGGSALTNSSFSTYSASASPKFAGWTESAGGAQVSQNSSEYYGEPPGDTNNKSLEIAASGSTTVTLKQTLGNMRRTSLDFNVPYFLRAMVKKSGSASGGSFNLRLGGAPVASLAVSSISSSNWTEVAIAIDENLWPANFNEDDFGVEVEWAQSSSAGSIYVDDVIFTPFDQIDGSYYVLRNSATSPTPPLVNDTFTVADTGGAPANAKIQYWAVLAGLGYFPHANSSPTITEP